jgi:hypothetical protein
VPERIGYYAGRSAAATALHRDRCNLGRDRAHDHRRRHRHRRAPDDRARPQRREQRGRHRRHGVPVDPRDGAAPLLRARRPHRPEAHVPIWPVALHRRHSAVFLREEPPLPPDRPRRASLGSSSRAQRVLGPDPLDLPVEATRSRARHQLSRRIEFGRPRADDRRTRARHRPLALGVRQRGAVRRAQPRAGPRAARAPQTRRTVRRTRRGDVRGDDRPRHRRRGERGPRRQPDRVGGDRADASRARPSRSCRSTCSRGRCSRCRRSVPTPRSSRR